MLFTVNVVFKNTGFITLDRLIILKIEGLILSQTMCEFIVKGLFCQRMKETIPITYGPKMTEMVLAIFTHNRDHLLPAIGTKILMVMARLHLDIINGDDVIRIIQQSGFELNIAGHYETI